MHPARAIEKIQPAPYHKKPPPQSILVRFPHLKRQNSSPRLDERAISDSGLNVVGRFFHKGGDLHPVRAIEKIQPSPHRKKPPPQSILVLFPHLKCQNPSPRLDESDQRQRFERRWAGFPLRRGFASSVAIKKKKEIQRAPHHKKPPPQSIIVRFPHLKRQNSSPRLNESDQRQRFERRRAVFP